MFDFKATVSDKIGIDNVGIGLISYVYSGSIKKGEAVFVGTRKCSIIKLMTNGKETEMISAGMNAVIIVGGLSYEEVNIGDGIIVSDAQRFEKMQSMAISVSGSENYGLQAPYNGAGKYIFISYRHLDYKIVFPVIEKIQEAGYAVWYDEGIDPGNEWDEEIAEHIQASSLMLAFISKNYIESDNCKDELNFARDEGIPRILIYLEDTELPAGMKMRLGRQQAIHYYKYDNKEVFYNKLFGASEIEKLSDSILKKNNNDAIKKAISAAADVYMSFIDKDIKWANLFRQVLINDHRRVVMASEAMRGNINDLEISVKGCRVVLFVLSKDALSDLSVIKELSVAVESGKSIIPVFVENFKLDEAFNMYLKDIAYIDAYSLKGRSLKVVVDAVKEILG